MLCHAKLQHNAKALNINTVSCMQRSIFCVYTICPFLGVAMPVVFCLVVLGLPRGLNKMQYPFRRAAIIRTTIVPFGVTYEKIGTIQRRLAWPLHKDDTLSRSGRSTDLNIYFCFALFKLVPLLVHRTSLR